MLSGGTVYGGGHWTCSKCGQVIFGSSIRHNCVNPRDFFISRTRKHRKMRIARIFLVI